MNNEFSRREFLRTSAFALAAATFSSCATGNDSASKADVIDIHQHVGYHDRDNPALITHQENMGIRRSILLPAGTPVNRPSTHDGISNGLQAKCLGNEECYQLAKAYPKQFLFGANEVPDLPNAG